MGAQPRFRADLVGTEGEQAGILYVDVADPRTGQTFRMYDFEWALACAMDGQRPSELLAQAVRSRWGYLTSAADIEDYARALDALGFLEGAEAVAAAPAAAAEALEEAITRPIERATPAAAPPEPSPPLFDLGPPAAPSETVVRAVADPDASSPVAEPPVAPPPPRSAPRPVVEPPVVVTPTAAAVRPDRAPGAPVDRAAAEREEAAPSRRVSFGLVAALLLLLLAGAAAAAYLTGLLGERGGQRRLARPGAGRVALRSVEARERTVSLIGAPAELGPPSPLTLAFAHAGVVAEIAASGTTVEAGAVLARLDGAARVEQELARLRERERFYVRDLERARAERQDALAARLEAKVEDKRRLIAPLEAQLGGLVLRAAEPSAVVEQVARLGRALAAGAPALRVAPSAPRVTFEVAAAELGPLGPGHHCLLVAAAGGGPSVGGEVIDVRPARAGQVAVTVRPDPAPPLAPGALRLAVAAAPLVVVPRAALARAGGRARVFVLRAGAAPEARAVTVAGYDAGSALLAAGLRAGERVVADAAAVGAVAPPARR